METTPPSFPAGGDGGEGQEQQVVVGTRPPSQGPQLSDIEQDGGEGMKRISDIEQDGYDADQESDAAVVKPNLTAPLLTGFFCR
jgi:hypothetical protein